MEEFIPPAEEEKKEDDNVFNIEGAPMAPAAEGEPDFQLFDPPAAEEEE